MHQAVHVKNPRKHTSSDPDVPQDAWRSRPYHKMTKQMVTASEMIIVRGLVGVSVFRAADDQQMSPSRSQKASPSSAKTAPPSFELSL